MTPPLTVPAVFSSWRWDTGSAPLSHAPALPTYEYPVMAPQRWKVSDWKNARLDAYRLLARGVTIYRGDGNPIPRDLQLGNLRDTYYEAAYGSLQPPAGTAQSASVTRLRPKVR